MRYFCCNDKKLPLDRTYLCGILNLTPDSFSDGGKWLSCGAEHALSMIAEGAEIVDLGAESTRPGHTPVDCEEELDRLMPTLSELAEKKCGILSVDTRHAKTAEKALADGAHILNSVALMRDTEELISVAAQFGAGYIYTHNVEGFETEEKPMLAVLHQFDKVVALAEKCRLPLENLILDPGFGFHKTRDQDRLLLKEIGQICKEFPVMAALSRKRFVKEAAGDKLEEIDRVSALWGAQASREGARFLRVHNVTAQKEALRRG